MLTTQSATTTRPTTDVTVKTDLLAMVCCPLDATILLELQKSHFQFLLYFMLHTVICRNKTPLAACLSEKGRIPAFSRFQGLSVLGRNMSVKKQENTL